MFFSWISTLRGMTLRRGVEVDRGYPPATALHRVFLEGDPPATAPHRFFFGGKKYPVRPGIFFPSSSLALDNDIPEESGHFRFLRAACLANIKGSVGLILAKTSVMRISIPLDLSSRSFIPLPRFIRSRRPTTLIDRCVYWHSNI